MNAPITARNHEAGYIRWNDAKRKISPKGVFVKNATGMVRDRIYSWKPGKNWRKL